jgi:hypothetical protein
MRSLAPGSATARGAGFQKRLQVGPIFIAEREHAPAEKHQDLY